MIGRFTHHHVCCRRPLGVGKVLRRLVGAELAFSVDFHLASAHQLIPAAIAALPRAGVVFVNSAEYATLAAHIDLGELNTVVVSEGPREVTLLQRGRVAATMRPPHAAAVEVTGAGDTLAGTFLAQLAQGASAPDALRQAVTAATRATGVPGLPVGVQRRPHR
mgnify:CR=1 FL=1